MGLEGSSHTIFRDGASERRTIAAMATAAGRAGLAVIRLSGPDALCAVRQVAGSITPRPRTLTRVRLIDPVDGSLIDHGMVAIFPAPASFTGEDVVEFHVHGGRAVPSALIGVLTALPGVRPAEPGEFARRAFENGKLDLTAAEGIADLIDAETAAQRRQALRQMEGELGQLFEGWRRELLVAMARFEATIDFSDEPMPEDLESQVHRNVAAIAGTMEAHLADGHRGERLRDGVMLTILGAPNVGKSSLLNWLAGREAAIVSETAGTTRDVIEVRLDLGSVLVIAADTAGMRDSEDAVEREGVRRARQRAASADIRLVVLDATTWPKIPSEIGEMIDEGAVVIVNKIDLCRPQGALTVAGHEVVAVSVHDGQGLNELMAAIQQRAAALCGSGGSPALTRARHRLALEEAVAALRRLEVSRAPELAAEELRLACRAIGRVTGRVNIEEMLDVIFREFCIGK